MSELRIDVEGDWLGGIADADDATFGALIVEADGQPLTEVHDSVSQSIRRTIRVPMVSVARWLLTEWWRLRWEPVPEIVTPDWREAHSMAGLGGGFAWPDLRIASDGELVELSIRGEHFADAAAIRYLRTARVEVSATAWERAVDRFLDRVESRLTAVLPAEREIAELRAELREERSNPVVALRCRREARAGYAPGTSPTGWVEDVERLAAAAGPTAVDDLLAVTQGGQRAWAAVRQLEHAPTTVDLSELIGLASPAQRRAKDRGVEAARRARERLGIAEGPLKDETLGEILGVRFPLGEDATRELEVTGGYRARDDAGTTHVILGSRRRSSQRFAIARLMGQAAQLPRDEQVLALTSARTATQRFTRAFARELLLPWAELDAFTDQHGTGESAIARVADRYQVDEKVVEYTLMSYGKLDQRDVYAS